MVETSDRRDSFLLEMYRVSWSNVSRSEEAVWKVFAAYAALIGGLSIAAIETERFIFLMLAIAFGFVGALFSQHANLWFLRNMSMISNLEKEFLKEGDYDTLIPATYKDKLNYLNFELWSMSTGLFLVINALAIYLYHPELSCGERLFSVIFYFVLFIIVIVYAVYLWDRYCKFKQGAPGKKQ